MESVVVYRTILPGKTKKSIKKASAIIFPTTPGAN
jgi:hypothetical protein